MRVTFRLMSLALLAGVLLPVSARAAGPRCAIICPSEAPPLVRQAASELSAYLSRWGEAPVPVSATAARHGPTIELRLAAEDGLLGEEDYRIASSGPARAAVVVIRGRTPQALQQGAYRLLREYGFGFYFDGDAIPPRPPSDWRVAEIKASPVFAVRGSLPWYNFLNSPTTWDDQDFRFFADQIIRSGQNFIGFHTYDSEPFAAFEYDGSVTGGEPLLTMESRVWGTWPLPASEFGFGSGGLFPGRFWGSDTACQAGDRVTRLAAQKALLARGLAYASARGVRTCLGFEVNGDPTDPAEQQRFRQRLLQLLRDYPILDYVWLWQSEARSMDGTAPPALRSQGGRVYREWEPAFATVPTPARRWEGMRVAYYGRLAQQMMDAQAPGVKLVLSGWGGDHWLHVSDYFPGWDKVLDKRIIFAALDDIRVSPLVSQYYQLPPDRERWAIPWYEYDGDQWFPQANASIFTQTVRDARAKGCQGLLAIHWRTKEVGESQALVADYAWHPDRTLAAFYRDYGVRRAGPAVGPVVGQCLQELDGMGYRWLGGGGQSECGEFAWCHVADAVRIAELGRLRKQLAEARLRLRAQSMPSGALGRLDDVIATIDRGLLFNEVAGTMIPGGPVDRALSLPPDDPRRASECAKVLAAMPHAAFSQMLALWAQTITSRGELGVLATVNGKAFADYRTKVARLQEGAGALDPIDLTAPVGPTSGLLSDYQLSSVAAGEPLPVRCMAFAGPRPARRVRLQFQASGMAAWTELAMRRLERCVFEVTIPAEAVREGWLRYRLAADLPHGGLAWPEGRGELSRQVTVLPRGALVPSQNAVRLDLPPLPSALALKLDPTAGGAVRVSWSPTAAGHELAVERRLTGQEWQRLGRTMDCVWEDAAAPARTQVEYRLMDGDRAVAGASVPTPAAPPVSPVERLNAQPRGTAVRLSWPPGDLTISYYVVERAPGAEGPFAPVSPGQRLAPDGLAANGYTDRPRQSGAVYYRVAAYGRGDAPPALSPVIAAQVLAEVPAPVLSVDFASGEPAGTVAGLEFTGPHSFPKADGRGVLHTEGGFVLPFAEKLRMSGPFTVAVRFRLTEMTQMPVLVSQGAWEAPGYFIQLFQARLRFYAGGAGCLDQNVTIAPGGWHTVVCVYDGASLTSFLDGALLGERPTDGPLKPSDAHFTVGRYTQEGPDWTFKGDLDFVRLYAHALEPWMVLRRSPAVEAVVDLDWSDPAVTVGGRQALWHQPVRLVDTAHGRAADLSGGLTVPFGDLLSVGERLTIETEFLLHDVSGMPVLLNQGLWPSEGYMVQVLGRRLRFHIGGVGSLDAGPELETERWYALKCTYDGTVLRAWLDGEPVGELPSDRTMVPSVRPLRLGRYELDEAQYVMKGLLGRTRIRGAVD